jgi:hypothetical protein
MDYMEEGQNSSWLLPNRVYEASRFGAVPVALADVQTGRFLAQHGLGVRLPRPEALETVLQQLTPDGYLALRRALDAAPRETFSAGQADCRALVRAIAGAPAPLVRDDRAPSTAKLVA